MEKLDMQLETKELHNVHVFDSGKWKGHEFKEDDLDKAIENFDNKVIEPYLNINHDNKITKKMQEMLKVFSFGNISKLWREGKRLMANFSQVPKLIAELIEAGTLKHKSVEWWTKYKHADGKVYNNVLEAVSFFGGDGVPALSSLDDVVTLYKLKSIEQEDVELMGDKIQVGGKQTMDITKTEYDELLKTKNDIKDVMNENIKLKSDNEELVTLKATVDELTQKVEDADKMKADMELKTVEDFTNKAITDVDVWVTDLKILPKYKDMKVKEYVALKDDEEGLKTFIEFHNELGKVVDLSNKTKSVEGSTEDYVKPDATGDNVLSAHTEIDTKIKNVMKAEKCTYNEASEKLNLYKSEVMEVI